MIKLLYREIELFTFPCGENNVRIKHLLAETGYNDIHRIYMKYENSNDIINLLLLVDALRHLKNKEISLFIDYIPFSRQDRVCNTGEAFSLKVFADLINNCNFKTVHVIDPHSDVAGALIHNLQITEQHEVFKKYFKDKEDFYLISPDAGSLKKIYKLAKEVNCLDVIECTKQRDMKTGEILKTIVHSEYTLKGKDCYIIDDICDGGKTFIEIAKILKLNNMSKIILMTTHGFFTKGLEVFDGLIDEIYTADGQMK